jgi:hypothetical protein
MTKLSEFELSVSREHIARIVAQFDEATKGEKTRDILSALSVVLAARIASMSASNDEAQITLTGMIPIIRALVDDVYNVQRMNSFLSSVKLVGSRMLRRVLTFIRRLSVGGARRSASRSLSILPSNSSGRASMVLATDSPSWSRYDRNPDCYDYYCSARPTITDRWCPYRRRGRIDDAYLRAFMGLVRNGKNYPRLYGPR